MEQKKKNILLEKNTPNGCDEGTENEEKKEKEEVKEKSEEG